MIKHLIPALLLAAPVEAQDRMFPGLQIRCFTPEQAANIAADRGERLLATARTQYGRTVEFHLNAETGTWAMLFRMDDGRLCVPIHGDGFTNNFEDMQPTGAPL